MGYERAETDRIAPLEMAPEEFRRLGHAMVDRIADFLGGLPARPVTAGESIGTIRAALGGGGLPAEGSDPQPLLEEAARLLFDHSLLNGHPRFMGYVTSSAAPIGALADLLAAAVNPNVGAWILSPMATEIESQTVRWIAEMLGYPADCTGLLVSGGNMANITPIIAARNAKAPWNVHQAGMGAGTGGRLRIYASPETHTWLEKAVDICGLGVEAIRWLPVDDRLRVEPAALSALIAADRRDGDRPFLVVGTAGTVSTGAVDPLPELAAICREHDLWFHVDGAYGGLAAILLDEAAGVEVPPELRGLREADSVAIDPHKWLYAPLEAGCVLVRQGHILRDAFSHSPPYYHFGDQGGEPVLNYYEYGLQNSRGFRALKVWLALRQAGRAGYVRMLADDIELARDLYLRVAATPELEAATQGLSITTFRYVPADLTPGAPAIDTYLNELNSALLTRLQADGEVFLSNAVVRDVFLLRACVVNFRTTRREIAAIPTVVTRLGREIDAARRGSGVRAG